MRVLLDANVLLRILLPSANLSRAVNVVFDAALAGAFTPLVIDDLSDEVRRRSVAKPYLADRITPEQTARFLAALRQSAIELPRLLPPFPRECRDEKDDYLLAYAESGHAAFLVTYDEDLLVLDGRFPFRIVRPPDFLAVLREQGLA